VARSAVYPLIDYLFINKKIIYMKKIILLLLSAVLVVNAAKSQEYDAHDLGKLKAFLVQPSAIEGKSNGEQLGLSALDMLTWSVSDAWLSKLVSVSWSEVVPCRVTEIDWGLYGSLSKHLGGDLDMSGCALLRSLEVNVNGLTDLSVRGCESLEVLDCSANELTALEVRGCGLLTELYCSFNSLTELDLSSCSSLKELNCGHNQLIALDVSHNRKLTALVCSANKLTALNVQNMLLTVLYCNHNELTSLDVSGCASLDLLFCYNNELTQLDVSGCVSLFTLYCQDNLLTSLNAGGCFLLDALWCQNNPLTSMLVSATIPAMNVAFPDVSAAVLYVPAGTADTYRTAQFWRNFGTIAEYGGVSTAFLPSPLVTVFSVGTVLSVLTPNNETVTVYSANGSLLYRSSKLPGHATFTIGHLPKGVIIVKGSTGWVRKIFR
jgi:hypothetical protein